MLRLFVGRALSTGQFGRSDRSTDQSFGTAAGHVDVISTELVFGFTNDLGPAVAGHWGDDLATADHEHYRPGQPDRVAGRLRRGAVWPWAVTLVAANTPATKRRNDAVLRVIGFSASVVGFLPENHLVGLSDVSAAGFGIS